MVEVKGYTLLDIFYFICIIRNVEKVIQSMKKDISRYFKDSESGKCLNKKVIEVLINSSQNIKENIISELGDDYINNPNDVTISTNLRLIFFRLKQKLQNLTTENIFDIEADKLIELYCINYQVENFDVDLLINHNLLTAYNFIVAKDKLYWSILQNYSYNLAIIIYLYTCKYLNRNLTCKEIAQVLNISLEDVYQNIHITRSILTKLKERQQKGKIYRKTLGNS